jgi:hypothetical protein
MSLLVRWIEGMTELITTTDATIAAIMSNIEVITLSTHYTPADRSGGQARGL